MSLLVQVGGAGKLVGIGLTDTRYGVCHRHFSTLTAAGSYGSAIIDGSERSHAPANPSRDGEFGF